MVYYANRQDSAYVKEVRVTVAVETAEGAIGLLFGSPYSARPSAFFVPPAESRTLKESARANNVTDLAGKLLKGIVKRRGSSERVIGLL